MLSHEEMLEGRGDVDQQKKPPHRYKYIYDKIILIKKTELGIGVSCSLIDFLRKNCTPS